MAKTDKNAFVPEIESLRGLAALSVVVGHCFGVLTLPSPYTYGNGLNPYAADLIKTITSPRAAVFLFFVLSGLALSIQLRSYQPTIRAYVAYIVRRLTRLMIPLWAALALGYFAWYYNGTTIDLGACLRDFLLVDVRLNEVNWSMQVEVLISLVFPLIFILFNASSLFLRLLSFIAFYYFYSNKTLGPILSYVALFYAGIFVAAYYERFAAINPRYQFILFLTGIFLMFVGRIYFPKIGIFGSVFGSALVVSFIMANAAGRATRVLRWPWIRMLGRCSYMLYLLHWNVLFILRRSVGSHFQFWIDHPFLVAWILLVLTLSISIPLALVTHHWIERPSIRLSKYLSTLIEGRENRLSSDKLETAAPGWTQTVGGKTLAPHAIMGDAR